MRKIMLGVALSLFVASFAHLGGFVSGRGGPFDRDRAGIAEAVIGVVLAVGALASLRWARAAVGFAIAGFVLGLSITVRGGHAPDIAYHLVGLPILIWTEVRLGRSPRRVSSPYTGDPAPRPGRRASR